MISVPRFSQNGRFMVAHPYIYSEDGIASQTVYTLKGVEHPTLYKLYRNARAASKYRDGLVLWFDASRLPIVRPDEDLEREIGLPDRISKHEFAERQIQLWAGIADRR